MMEGQLDQELGYCKNDTCKEFEDEILNNLLGNLRKFDLRTIETKPNMAKARKRVIFGAIETRKQLELGKIKAIIIARNLSDEMLQDEDFKFCIGNGDKEIPKIYSLKRKQLGLALLNQSSRIGIVGILKLDGVYETWNEIVENFNDLKDSWMKKYENNPENIWKCAYYGHFDLLKRILENCESSKSLINQGCFKTGKTPLIGAVERDHYEIVKLLIDNGADQDIPDFALNRPIHLVKSEKIASLLYYSDKENASGYTAIESAIINQRIEVVRVFIDKTKIKPERFLFAATITNSDKSIRFLVKTLCSVDLTTIRNSKGNDLFMQIVENGSYEVFKFLISQKIRIDYEKKNKNDENIMEISKRVSNVGIQRYLEKHYENKVLL